jgi:TPR repeat protein
MNTRSQDLFRISFLCWFFSLAGVLQAQTGQDQSSVASKPANQGFIVQKDYDELRRSAGRVKAKEIPAIEQKATAGDAQAQLLLGMLSAMGCGIVPRDHAKSLFWYHKAADQGSSMALNQIGIYYDRLAGHDKAEAFKWYRKAAEHKDAVAQYNVGSMYQSGEGVEQDGLEAAAWYEGAVENGYHEGLDRLVSLYNKGEAMPTRSLEDNQKAGLRLLESWANQNNTYAEVDLAEAYKAGSLGFSKDEAQAIYWLRKAAESYSQAQVYLGYAYSHGEGVPKDEAEAVKWYQKAAEQGNVNGQGDLGYMYEHGKGVPKDMAAAAKWYQAAAEQRDAAAQYELGGMYEDGRGVHKDAVTSIMWFLLAKDGGQPDFEREIHWNWQFVFHRHPYEPDYREALKRAKAWKEQHDCR